MGSSASVAGWIALSVVIAIAPGLAFTIGPAPTLQDYVHRHLGLAALTVVIGHAVVMLASLRT